MGHATYLASLARLQAQDAQAMIDRLAGAGCTSSDVERFTAERIAYLRTRETSQSFHDWRESQAL
jgi:hypothetical protein